MISAISAMLSALCAAVSTTLCVALGNYRISRALPGPRRHSEAARPLPSDTLLLSMIAVAMHRGASLPRALEAVGESAGHDFGALLAGTARLLNEGYPWQDAWSRALSDGAYGATMMLVHDALEDSWVHGASPTERLEATITQVDEDERSRIEQGASRLSIRLLVPTGLCFLPAFLFIGVIPAIASFAS
ncbi:type II secretion system F family protein [Bifidobacterium tibiigranuli]|jgi:pilus assembly protein TadC|uniref:type II secretion system F family protein n=1 Tax=Bifidobacterium tibiigranuli TaxID=2172043 RepID=UPI0026EAFD62|nr:type II secretion system F family protein [Bifidobacterium tibiigranuli]MCI1650462.1 type II secretion system F family protein [Bifidobacterium tibiigranuli]MCI2186084.1 type II secretion system F family protein [Bifidobacterium tibiigranuli]MCI2204129.1 type II secretion system F family protein [Bifidobacterium tibiigranuli]